MLQEMRQYTKTWLSWLFVIPLVISFAAWGINDVFRPATPTTVATVGGVDISIADFKRQWDLRKKQIEEQRGQPLTPDDVRSMGLAKLMLDDVTDQAALDNLANRMGLAVSDAEVTSQIRAMHAFDGPLGGFDRQTFDRKVAEQGFTEQGFINEAHRVLAQQQILVPMQATFEAPNRYLFAIVAAETEARAVDYVVIQPSSLAPVAPPSDATLATYLKTHAAQFSTPEYRDVSFAYISPADVASQVKVTPDQIKQLYDANTSTYNVPERRDLEQMNFASEADARAARTKVDSGQTFEQVAASLGKKQSDIAIGSLTAKDLPDARGTAVFALPVGGTTEPVQNGFGWYLLHVNAITPGKTTTLEQATPDITKTLMAQLEGAKISDMMNACQDELDHGVEVQDAATKSGMKYAHVAAMDRHGLDPSGKATAAPADDEFLAEVFSKEIGEAGDPEQAKKSQLAFVIKVNGVTPPKAKPLDEVRAHVLAAWTQDQQAAQLRAKVIALAADADRGQDLSQIAQTLGATVQKSPALSRSTRDDTFSKALVSSIFDTAPGGATVGPLAKGNGFVLARVTGISHPNLQSLMPVLQRARQEMSEQMGGDFAIALSSAAKAKQGVTIHPDVVNNVIGGGDNS